MGECDILKFTSIFLERFPQFELDGTRSHIWQDGHIDDFFERTYKLYLENKDGFLIESVIMSEEERKTSEEYMSLKKEASNAKSDSELNWGLVDSLMSDDGDRRLLVRRSLPAVRPKDNLDPYASDSEE